MTEEFLGYLWEFRLLNTDLLTTSGEPVIILHPGTRNRDGGPDYVNARIRINNTLWAGNVEIHINSDDWFRHNHHLDKTYENVVLHVVFHHNPSSEYNLKVSIPTLVVEGQFAETIFTRYRYFQENPQWIPCRHLIHEIDPIIFNQWSTALSVERLVDRSREWKNLLESNKLDWEETFYQGLAKDFGLKINVLPFELLAKSLPLKLVLKYQRNPFQLEAMAFGQSGMLNRHFTEEYPLLLKAEYEYLAQKHGLKPIESSQWKFLRLRPSGFPTLRIAQWAVFLQHISTFFNLILKCGNIDEIMRILKVKAMEYWDQHYLFEKLSPQRPKIIGTDTIQMLILNFAVPFLFFYGEEKQIDSVKEHSLKILEELPGENNSVISQWKALGMPSENALQTQALIQLKKNYCDKKKCLSCRIGARLLGREVILAEGRGIRKSISQ